MLGGDFKKYIKMYKLLKYKMYKLHKLRQLILPAEAWLWPIIL